jgi:hypothetical protein
LNDCTRTVGRSGGQAVGLLLLILTARPPDRLSAQFEQFSSENLRLRAVGVDVGMLGGTNVRGTATGALRFDIGTVTPRVRVLLGASYFQAHVRNAALHRFEQRLKSVVIDPSGDDTIHLGQVAWSDVTGDIDLQYTLPQGRAITTYAGLGLSVHARNGSGSAIRGTFVEDALDGITAGLNATAGAEFGAGRWRVTLDGRGVLASGLSSVGISMGVRYRWVGVGHSVGPR